MAQQDNAPFQELFQKWAAPQPSGILPEMLAPRCSGQGGMHHQQQHQLQHQPHLQYQQQRGAPMMMHSGARPQMPVGGMHSYSGSLGSQGDGMSLSRMPSVPGGGHRQQQAAERQDVQNSDPAAASGRDTGRPKRAAAVNRPSVAHLLDEEGEDDDEEEEEGSGSRRSGRGGSSKASGKSSKERSTSGSAAGGGGGLGRLVKSPQATATAAASRAHAAGEQSWAAAGGHANGQAKASGSSKVKATGKGRKRSLLTRADLCSDLTGRILLLLWPDDMTWWEGKVLSVDGPKAIIYYEETGQEEEADLLELVDAQELAWPEGQGPGSAQSSGSGRAVNGGSAVAANRAPKKGADVSPEHQHKKARSDNGVVKPEIPAYQYSGLAQPAHSAAPHLAPPQPSDLQDATGLIYNQYAPTAMPVKPTVASSAFPPAINPHDTTSIAARQIQHMQQMQQQYQQMQFQQVALMNHARAQAMLQSQQHGGPAAAALAVGALPVPHMHTLPLQQQQQPAAPPPAAAQQQQQQQLQPGHKPGPMQPYGAWTGS